MDDATNKDELTYLRQELHYLIAFVLRCVFLFGGLLTLLYILVLVRWAWE